MPQALPLIFAGVAAAAGISAAVTASKARKDAAAAAAEQEQAARQAAALEAPVGDTNASFQLGVDTKKITPVAKSTKRKVTPIMGAGAGGITASSVGGL